MAIQRLLDDEQRRDWIRLLKSENVGPATFRQLINRFGSAAAALNALPELSARGGLRRPIKLYPQEAAEKDLANAERIGARFVAIGEAEYPELLRHIDAAPPLLCIRGRTEFLTAPGIGIVGARNASAAGRRFARDLAVELASAGLTIISGLARGIDTAAHEASLSRGTVAVLAGGLDVIYPPENANLHESIGNEGVLATEMTPGTIPKAEHFPRRNRIISGMSFGVIVVEAELRSGSLITARLANEQGREVFAVPGSPLDPRSAGPNKLIRDGATLITSAADVLEALGPVLSGQIPTLPEPFMAPASPYEPDGGMAGNLRDHIINLLGPAPIEIDDLIRESGAGAAAVMTVLLELELAGRLSRHGRQRVSLHPGA